MAAIEAILLSTRVPETLRNGVAFGSLLAHARAQVERLGIRGQDAETIALRVLEGLEPGPLQPEGSTTVGAVLRHRLHLAALHWWRSEGRRRRATAQAAAEGRDRERNGEEPSEVLAAREDRARVQRALLRLRAGEAEAIRLAYLAQIPLEEVRRHLRCSSLNALYVRLSKARAHLREILSEESST